MFSRNSGSRSKNFNSNSQDKKGEKMYSKKNIGRSFFQILTLIFSIFVASCLLINPIIPVFANGPEQEAKESNIGDYLFVDLASDTPPAATVHPGEENVLFARFILTGSSEGDIQVSRLNVHDGGINGPSVTDISLVGLMSNGVLLGTGKINGVGFVSFNLESPLLVPQGEQVSIQVRANIAETAEPSGHFFRIHSAEDIEAVYQDDSSAQVKAIWPVEGNMMSSIAQVEQQILEGFLSEPVIDDYMLQGPNGPGGPENLGHLALTQDTVIVNENRKAMSPYDLELGCEVRIEARIVGEEPDGLYSYEAQKIKVLAWPDQPEPEVLIQANNLNLIVGESGIMTINISTSHQNPLSEPIISGTLKARLAPAIEGETGVSITNFELTELLDGWTYETEFDEEYVEVRFANATPLELPPSGGGTLAEVEFATADTGTATFVLEEVTLNEGQISVVADGGEVRVVEEPSVEIIEVYNPHPQPGFRDIDFWAGDTLVARWSTQGYSTEAEASIEVVNLEDDSRALIIRSSVDAVESEDTFWEIPKSTSGCFRVSVSVSENGKPSSYAESGKFFISRYGDVDGDGEINAYDAARLLRILIVGGPDDDVVARKRSRDVSGNGSIAPYDAALILQYCVQLISEFPAERGMGAPALLTAKQETEAIVGIVADLEGRVQESVLDQLKKLAGIEGLPEKSTLLQNFPNPFNPETWIPYQLAKNSEVIIRIFSQRGQLIRQFDLGRQEAGSYKTRNRAAYWDGRNDSGEKVASGVYFYTIRAGDFSATRRMIILK